MPVADAQAVSFGDSADAIKVYAEWELKDPVTKHTLTLAQRTAAFEAWVSRMLVKTFHWGRCGRRLGGGSDSPQTVNLLQ